MLRLNTSTPTPFVASRHENIAEHLTAAIDELRTTTPRT
jgi:hypothetical protein